MARGNRQGNNALLEDSENRMGFGWNTSDSKFLKKLKRTKFMHELILTNNNFQSWIRRKFVYLIEAGNVDLAAFVATFVTKYGGYGFSQYHLLALVMDMDPKAELEKLKLKEQKEKEKAEKEGTKIEVEEEAGMGLIGKSKKRPRKMFNSRYKPMSSNQVQEKAIKFGEPFLSKEIQLELLKKMRKTNVTKKANDNLGISPLHCACINPNPLTLKHFIEVGDDLYVYDLDLRKPVHYAACSSSPENLKVLMEKGVDVRDTDKIRKTPLMYACQYGRLENVKLIVENTDINLDFKCRKARGPIHFAAENGHLGNFLGLIKTDMLRFIFMKNCYKIVFQVF